eukprot:6214313-Pleurochrysis_carterae.AAC.3
MAAHEAKVDCAAKYIRVGCTYIAQYNQREAHFGDTSSSSTFSHLSTTCRRYPPLITAHTGRLCCLWQLRARLIAVHPLPPSPSLSLPLPPAPQFEQLA